MAKVKIEEKVEGKVCRGKGQNNGEAGGREARRESNGKMSSGLPLRERNNKWAV